MATYNLINSTTVGSGGSASIEFTSIPATYTDLVLKVSSRTSRSATSDFFQINLNSSAANFASMYLEGNGSVIVSGNDTVFIGATNGNTATSSSFGNFELYIANYAGSYNKTFGAYSVNETAATQAYQDLVAGVWSQTAAITSIKLLSATSSNFLEYTTAYLYGISNA